ncbi:MAG: NTP transferase domain-containing protein [bacterium]|nr:NTP transferase domain-containing protein [bacterium]
MFTLVVMAAGLGSRFGGTKQLAEVGPNGEAFLDFAIADACSAGASKVVLIVRSNIEDDVRAHLSRPHLSRHSNFPNNLQVALVCQDQHGPQRAKPWGTAHAVACAHSEIAGPFMVCNADDYYGPSAYAKMAEAIPKMDTNQALLCGYHLAHTLPSQGVVTRGICRTEGNRLTAITEQQGLSAANSTYPPDTLVSMNLWAFSEAFVATLQTDLAQFLSHNQHSSDAEYLLPHAVAQQMHSNGLQVNVIPTQERWIGVTNPEDLQVARTALAHRT